MDPISIQVNASEMELARAYAKKFELGGRSFRDRASRMENLGIDQLVGVLGEMAFCRYLTGDINLWRLTKWARFQCFSQNDNGQDILGLNVDVKTSLVRSSSLPISEYRLAVREEELRTDTIYISCLITGMTDEAALVNIMGWADREALPDLAVTEGTWAGSHVLPVNRLHKLPDLRWFGR